MSGLQLGDCKRLRSQYLIERMVGAPWIGLPGGAFLVLDKQSVDLSQPAFERIGDLFENGARTSCKSSKARGANSIAETRLPALAQHVDDYFVYYEDHAFVHREIEE